MQVQFTSLKDVRRNKKKKWPRIAFDVIFVVFIITNVISLYIGNNYYKKIFEINTKTDLDQYETYKSTFNERRFSDIQREEVSVASKNNYKLYGTYIKNPKATNNTIILLHRLGGSRWSSMKYTDMYLDKGFNVLVYDGRHHGYSGGDNVTYGFYEKDDLDKWVDWVYRKNKGGIIGVHGESTGAAAALLHSKINENKKKVSFYIADSAFSDLNEFFTIRIKQDYNLKSNLLIKPLIFYIDKINKLKNGFYLTEVSPINIVGNIKTPIMFIHGANDTYVPKTMSEDLYKAKSGTKQIYIAPASDNNEAYLNNQDEYRDRVYTFIDSVISINN
ncbi:alpha/beta hydrolase [Clostridium sp. SYSU_GA19001]|uniref:alpha/beta hydrolase n=1 Tax=Clostridium caldaquaticum TaxID=2940653 RepID=UPI002077338D|nr:alpha/beta hydrolase [Clostridium caldaquaticum]MCM8711839.1 alpha/beta hydrolase [Clostridium caldaquaticum]